MLKESAIERTKWRFGSQVTDYNKYRSDIPNEIYRMLFNLSPKAKKLQVLDLGCGTGRSTEKLVRSNTEVVGCDHDIRMLQQAKKNANQRNLKIKYYLCSAEELPFKAESFDIINIGHAFHWFANMAAVKSMYRVLKPGGLLFIYWKQIGYDDIKLRKRIFCKFNPDYDRPSMLITDAECTKILSEGGFENIKTVVNKYYFEYDFEKAIGRLRTIGSYFNLSAQQKRDFEGVATKTFRDYFGKKKKIKLAAKMHICYAYKSEHN